MRRGFVIMAGLGLLISHMVHAAWWEADEGGGEVGVTEILGSSEAAWDISPSKEKGGYNVITVDETRALKAGGALVTLRSRTDYRGDIDCELVFRFLSRKYASGRVGVKLGVKDASAKDKPLYADVVVIDDGMFQCGVVNPDEQNARKRNQSTRIYLRGTDTRRLAWDEGFRRRVEDDFARLPHTDESWHRLRFVSHEGQLRTTMDGQLFSEWEVSPEKLAGQLEITLRGEVALASLRVHVPDDHGLFEPVALDGVVNESVIDDDPLDRDSLPPAGRAVEVNGVPFVFANPDGKGDDHVDVGQSWVQIGELEGYFTSAYREFGGRWASPFECNPRRLQIAIPKRHYRRLHLIAAADDDSESVPLVSAQFVRPEAGYPQTYVAGVPTVNGKAGSEESALAVRLASGRSARLYHIVIPIDPGDLDELALMDLDVPYLTLELTKQVKLYRSYPDPISYSYHGAGLPSSVHVYAATLERPAVTVDLQPDQVGHVWTAPERPGYTVTAVSELPERQQVALRLDTRSYDGEETTTQEKVVTLSPNAPQKMAFPLKLNRYGTHDVTLTMTYGDETWTSRRMMAYLHPDTRERGNWEDGHGPILGYWSYGGGHLTRPREETMEVMARAGLETMGGSFDDKRWSDEDRALARKWKMVTFKQFDGYDHWITGKYAANLKTMDDPAAADAEFLKSLREHEGTASDLVRTEIISFFPEPHIGPITAGNWPSYYGEPRYELTEQDRVKFEYYGNALIRGGRLVRQNWPDVKIMFPHGNPLFCIPYLRYWPESKEFIDGVAVDSPNFERVPEMQTGQETIHRLYQLNEEFRKAGKDPYYIFLEGNFVSTHEGACSLPEQADFVVRNVLHYYAYGINRLATVICSDDAADYYGEEHYGNGYVCGRYPLCCPKPAYAATATMTRHINRANFAGPVNTGSHSVIGMAFDHYKTGERIYAFWTVRGTRPIKVTAAPDAKVELYDSMDNVTELPVENGAVTFTATTSPAYVHGLEPEIGIFLGVPDHSDSAPGELAVKLGNLGDGSWQLKAERDLTYENNLPLQIARKLGRMTARPLPVGPLYGGTALAVHLDAERPDRITMPWYTTLAPKRPVTIPGKASHLGLWVRAASDWGRVVYSLRDAKGERWISIGTREQWNADDIHGWSKFCFDGWRYLRFELPADSPYDTFREYGTTWWGHFGEGDGLVDLPLELEKIIVERRTHVLVVNRPLPADSADVLLGDLYAEYASPADRSDEVVRLSRLRMPVPEGVPPLDNPIEALRADASLPAVTGVRVTDPPQTADGTQCDVHFDAVPEALSYDVWVAPYADGRGAMQLGKGWKASGQRIRGLRPETDFYIFVAYADKDKKTSEPSQGLKIRLKDLFFQK